MILMKRKSKLFCHALVFLLHVSFWNNNTNPTADLLDSQVYKKFETTEIYGFSFVSCTLSSRLRPIARFEGVLLFFNETAQKWPTKGRGRLQVSIIGSPSFRRKTWAVFKSTEMYLSLLGFAFLFLRKESEWGIYEETRFKLCFVRMRK